MCNGRRSDHVHLFLFFVMHVQRDANFVNISMSPDGDRNDDHIIAVIFDAKMLHCSYHFYYKCSYYSQRTTELLMFLLLLATDG
jgi:hypothetical protein